MADAPDMGDLSMSDSLHDFTSVFGGVLFAPWIKGGAACVVAGCEALGLPLDIVYALAFLFVADFALGIWLAVSTKTFSLRKLARGLAKIPVYTVVLIIAWVCQYVVNAMLGQSVAVPVWACSYLTMHEALSILTKCEALDLPVPGLLKRVIARVNHAAETHVDKVLDVVDSKEKKRGK